SASVNLYLDQRQELDFIQYRLTHGIRHLYINISSCTVKVQLSTQQRLDITLDSKDQCQGLYNLLSHIKNKPDDTANFPKHKPKIGITKPDPTTAYLTANDTPVDTMLNPFLVDGPVTSTPSKRRAIVQRSAAALEQMHKKSRVQPAESIIEPSQHRFDTGNRMFISPPILSSKIVVPQPEEDNMMIITPKKQTPRTHMNSNSEKTRRIVSLSPFSSMKPQFHSAIPSPGALRPISVSARRYGCEAITRKSKRLSSLERPTGTRCVTAVLQALFRLDLVARDLKEPYWLHFSSSQPVLFKSLVDAFSPYSKRHSIGIKDETVSENVIKKTKGRLGDEDDAREFLNDTLNQVRHEFRELNAQSPCPISRLFECIIDHTLVCMDCGNEIVQTEHYQDFCLEIPACDNNRSSQRAMSIGGLFPQMFDSQQIVYECGACQSESAMAHRSISKLPDILVVYLKRFSIRPIHGYGKNRSRVAIDGTLEFSQFCSPSAFLPSDNETGDLISNDDDQLLDDTHFPSNSPPSSSSLWFSSASPVERDGHFESPSSLPANQEYIDVDRYQTVGQGTASNPFVLNSDEGDSFEVSTSQSFSYYEPPSEDEQYQWAMEESLRGSQSLSQSFSQESVKYDNNCETRNNTGDATRINGTDERDGSVSRDSNEVGDEMRPSLFPSVNSDIKDDSINPNNGDNFVEDEDEELKAAIIASLAPENTQKIGEEKLQEKENRDLEEAIWRSLLDSEENKENISPEKRTGKKGHKGKRSSTLSRCSSQSQIETLENNREYPARLLRANTIDVVGGQHSGTQYPSFSQSQSQEESSSSFSAAQGEASSSQQYERASTSARTSIVEDIAILENPKGKEKAHHNVRTETKEHSIGLFQLQAMVSHTGLASTTSDGHYVCDGLGADGVWRCSDGGKSTRIGSIADLSRYRGRSGYLFFYVHGYSDKSNISVNE
ncbi:Ubiquitin carboxyl-terminal hydrolase 29, partial [Entomortierella beljakovae]